MYPLPDGLFAARNQWYVAAWSAEIGREPMERWILNQPVALYRKRDGAVVALEGRCPHRHFPLGKSRVVDDNIECGYHGITFDSQGTCVRVPSQKVVPQRCRIQSYPVVERWQWIWIWLGDPARADVAAIPDHAAIGLTSSEYTLESGSYHAVPGRYMLMHDNLFDLTHFAYLHRTSIGSGDFAGTPEVTEAGPGWLSTRFDFKGIACPAFFADIFGYHGPVDRAFGMKFFMPGLHVGYDDFFRAAPEGGPRGEFLGGLKVYHAITPATRHSAHYFFANGRTFKRDDAEFGRNMLAGLNKVIDEDMVATREIEAMISGLDTLPGELLLKSDKTCVLGRRKFEEMIRAEG
jgi:phenylpropionate dioxygenase-like ring-hydroxylating dioxygenase large terminal subunit